MFPDVEAQQQLASRVADRVRQYPLPPAGSERSRLLQQDPEFLSAINEAYAAKKRNEQLMRNRPRNNIAPELAPVAEQQQVTPFPGSVTPSKPSILPKFLQRNPGSSSYCSASDKRKGELARQVKEPLNAMLGPKRVAKLASAIDSMVKKGPNGNTSGVSEIQNALSNFDGTNISNGTTEGGRRRKTRRSTKRKSIRKASRKAHRKSNRKSRKH